MHARGVVVVAERTAGYAHVAHREAERRRRRRFVLGFFGRLGLLRRGFHHIPVHGAVGPLVRMELRTVEQHLGHLEALVAEERHEVHDHRNAVRSQDRVALETLRAREGQVFQFERRVGEMAQQAQVERAEVEPRGKPRIGFASDHFAEGSAERHRHHEGRRQQQGQRDARNFQRFLHNRYLRFVKFLLSARGCGTRCRSPPAHAVYCPIRRRNSVVSQRSNPQLR